jgi:hypothetical protein
MKTSWPKIVAFSRGAQAYLAQDEANKNTKLGYAIKRVISQLEKIQTDYMQHRDDASIDCAATDEKGVLLTEADGRFRFTPEKLKERNRLWRELDAQEMFEIEPYFATEVPDIDESIREALTGFVIKEDRERLEIVA